MKRIFTIIFALLIFTSCDENKHCYTCSTKIVTYRGASETNSTVNTEVCGKTRFEIKRYAEEKSETSITTIEGTRQEKTITTTCDQEH
jgi:hypothetical protein